MEDKDIFRDTGHGFPGGGSGGRPPFPPPGGTGMGPRPPIFRAGNTQY